MLARLRREAGVRRLVAIRYPCKVLDPARGRLREPTLRDLGFHQDVALRELAPCGGGVQSYAYWREEDCGIIIVDSRSRRATVRTTSPERAAPLVRALRGLGYREVLVEDLRRNLGGGERLVRLILFMLSRSAELFVRSRKAAAYIPLREIVACLTELPEAGEHGPRRRKEYHPRRRS